MFKTVSLILFLAAATAFSAPLQERNKEANQLNSTKIQIPHADPFKNDARYSSSEESSVGDPPSGAESDEYSYEMDDMSTTEDPLDSNPHFWGRTTPNWQLLKNENIAVPPPWGKRNNTDYVEFDPFADGDEGDDDAEADAEVFGDLNWLNSDIVLSFATVDGTTLNPNKDVVTESTIATDSTDTTDLPESTTPSGPTEAIEAREEPVDMASTTESIETTTAVTELNEATTSESMDPETTTQVIQTTEASEMVKIASTTESVESTTETTESVETTMSLETTESSETTAIPESAEMLDLAKTTEISITTETIETTNEPSTTSEPTTIEPTTEILTSEAPGKVSTDGALPANIPVEKSETLESMASVDEMIIVSPENVTVDAVPVEVQEAIAVKQFESAVQEIPGNSIVMVMNNASPVSSVDEIVKMNVDENLNEEIMKENEAAPLSVAANANLLSSTTSTTESVIAVESANANANAAAPEARSLNMSAPPPKLTRHLSEDGVEVISGYSYVKHN